MNHDFCRLSGGLANNPSMFFFRRTVGSQEKESVDKWMEN